MFFLLWRVKKQEKYLKNKVFLTLDAEKARKAFKKKGFLCLIRTAHNTASRFAGQVVPSSPYSLFDSYSKLMKIHSGAPFHPNTYSLFSSCSKLMKILSGVPLLLQYISIVQFLFKTDEHPLWGLSHPPIHILYLILIQN